MPLEPVDHLDDLVVTNPTDTDPVSEGDNHIRNLKIALAAGVTGSADETRLLVQGIARALAVVTGFDVRTTVDQLLEIRLLNTDTPDVGIALEMEQTTGKGAIRETDGAGLPGNAWVVLTPAEGVALLFNDIIRVASTDTGAKVDGSLVDLDNSLADEQTEIQLRNLIGGWKHGVNATTGRLQLDQVDAAGVFEHIAATFERDGKFGLRFAGEEVMQSTVGNVHNSRAEIKDDVGVFKPVGFNNMPTDIGGNPNSFTLDTTFNGRRIRPNATITITVVGASLPTDGVVVISNQGAGTVTLSGSGGVQFTLFLDGSTSIVASFTMIQGQIITLTRLQASDTYEVWGSFVAP